MYADLHHAHHWSMCISWLEIVTSIGRIRIISSFSDTHHAHHWSMCISWFEIVIAIGWIKIIYGVSTRMYADTHHTHHWSMCITWLEIVTFISWIKTISGLSTWIMLACMLIHIIHIIGQCYCLCFNLIIMYGLWSPLASLAFWSHPPYCLVCF